jgi:ribose transport system substrate-binding protein
MGKSTRLLVLLIVLGAWVLSACSTTEVEVTRVVKETVVEEKEVEVEVTRVVKETVVEEKEVEVTRVVLVEGEVSDYVPQIRPALRRWRIGNAEGMAEIDFVARVTQGIHEVADEMGVEIAVECDNAVDVEKTFTCMDTIIAADVDGIITANWHEEIEEEYSNMWLEAEIPAVTWDGVHPKTVHFGASNYDAGFAAGEWLGNFMLEQGWDDAVLVLGQDDTPIQPGVERMNGCKEGLLSVVDLPEDRIFELAIPTPAMYENSYNTMTDWLTGHPNVGHILSCSINDQRSTGISGACEAAGRAETCAVIGQGADAPALTEMHERTDEESSFKGSVAYFPENYGQYLVPMIVDLIEGKEVPEDVRLPHLVIDRSNVDQYYPPE